MNGSSDWEAYLERLVQECEDRQRTADLRGARITDQDGDGQPGIAALPTIYHGTQFRSLLEACWAATLDSLNIVWEYEPQTFQLESGPKYLPDFHLTEIGVWLEVKGPGIPRIEKAFELGKMLACGCDLRRCTCRWPGGEMVIVGHPPAPYAARDDDKLEYWPSYAKAKLARRHGGFIRWTSTRQHNSWMTDCSSCRRTTWVEAARIARCSACGEHSEAPLHRDFEDEYQFVRLPWLSAANTQETEGEAA